ncbi:MAG: CBS and ACT domain-containing protein [Sphaerochaetaceae bacterium]|nr:CBS and ACT domain-containing protein [Sphaerochaetaceae bacterium]
MIIERRMTRNPVTATPDMNIQEAKELMVKEKVHRLPVLDSEKKLVGVISEKDILEAAPSPVSTLSAYEMNYLMSKLTVKKLMSRHPVTLDKNATIEEAARLMIDQDLSCLPVLEDGKLVGIVSKSDLFKILMELFGARHFGTRVEFLVDDRMGVLAEITSAVSKHGLNIVSYGTFAGNDPTTAICTMKIQGAKPSQVLDIMKPFVKEILDIREV